MSDNPDAPVVEAFVDAYLDAWARHDAGGLTTFYAPDADLANPRGKALHGKDFMGDGKPGYGSCIPKKRSAQPTRTT